MRWSTANRHAERARQRLRPRPVVAAPAKPARTPRAAKPAAPVAETAEPAAKPAPKPRRKPAAAAETKDSPAEEAGA